MFFKNSQIFKSGLENIPPDTSNKLINSVSYIVLKVFSSTFYSISLQRQSFGGGIGACEIVVAVIE